jgi:hypothetical protein
MEKEVVEEVRQSKIKEGKKNGLESWQISKWWLHMQPKETLRSNREVSKIGFCSNMVSCNSERIWGTIA